MPPVLYQLSRLPPQFLKHIEDPPLKSTYNGLTHGSTTYILKRLQQLVTPNFPQYQRTAQELWWIMFATVSLH